MAIGADVESMLRAKFEAVLPHLDERSARLVLAGEARSLGHGAIAAVARASGASRSRIQDGVLRLSMEPVDPRDLISDAARASSTTERLRLELDAPARVVCDADAIVRVLTNLFDNARKYSPEGTPITVAVSSDARRVAVDVHNAGDGIAEEDREAIFERFRRGDETEAPGTGLGLYISRGLVRAHGGELEVGEPPEEGGTRFTFWLPVLDPGEHEVDVGPSEGAAVEDYGVIESAVTQVTVPAGGRR